MASAQLARQRLFSLGICSGLLTLKGPSPTQLALQQAAHCGRAEDAGGFGEFSGECWVGRKPWGVPESQHGLDLGGGAREKGQQRPAGVPRTERAAKAALNRACLESGTSSHQPVHCHHDETTPKQVT